MAFLNNAKLLEIRSAAKEGNEKALMVLQALRKMVPQQDLDRVVEDYYNVNSEPQIEEPQVEETQVEETQIEEAQPIVEEQPIPQELEPEVVVDLTNALDVETDGLFDENEISELSFADYLGNKKRDAMRSRKNADYFKAYDMNGRQNYMQSKVDNYKKKFDGIIRNIDRKFDDMNKSIELYSTKANDMLDDGIELDMEQVGRAYDDFTNSSEIMNSFGRHWDERDTDDIMFAISELMKKYGKNNVIAAINTLKSDNEGYKKYLNNQIDTEISRYSKSVENLLK